MEQSNLAKSILTLIERRTGTRSWRGMKDWESIIMYMCAEQEGTLDKYFPPNDEKPDGYNWNAKYREKVKDKTDRFLRSIK